MYNKYLKQCEICNKMYSTAPFANLDAAGNERPADITLYGHKYNVCYKCMGMSLDMIKKGLGVWREY